MDKVNRIKELVRILRQASVAYYNDNNPMMPDKQYDDLYDELEALEKETGIIYSNSPTQNVGCEVVSNLPKVKHTHSMLSLSKTKSTDELMQFSNKHDAILSLKMDGLTICLTYDKGKLIRAETRGNGETGEIVTHNARVFDNIPLSISYDGYLEVEGEAIITYYDFESINAGLPEDQKYKNPRNLASGSVRQLDSDIAAKRHLKFVVWKMPLETESMIHGLKFAKELGFTVVPYINVKSNTFREEYIDLLKNKANEKGYPIDGLVITYDDIKYGKSLGMTGHHPKHSIAYKFYDEEEVTRLRDVEWSMGKTGQLTPVAIFDPVELEGTTVSRASLHNVSIFKELQLGIGDEITVYKANAIIPQVRENLTKSGTLEIPWLCPVCNEVTEIQKENNSEILVCTNPICKTKLVKRLAHFVSRKGMNIDGLSEETLGKFVEWGWLNNLADIYKLPMYKDKLMQRGGFGERSAQKICDAIEKSKNVELANFITALGIQGIGTSQAKELAKKFHTWNAFIEACKTGYDFTNIDGFGEVTNTTIHEWFISGYFIDNVEFIVEMLHFTDNNVNSDNSLEGMTFVITGSLNHFSNRDALKAELESKGAKVSGSVSVKTSYLINNDVDSTSSKNKKAKELNIPIVTEQQILDMFLS